MHSVLKIQIASSLLPNLFVCQIRLPYTQTLIRPSKMKSYWFLISNTYSRLLQQRPGLIFSLNTGLVMVAGDLITQLILEKKSIRLSEPFKLKLSFRTIEPVHNFEDVFNLEGSSPIENFENNHSKNKKTTTSTISDDLEILKVDYATKSNYTTESNWQIFKLPDEGIPKNVVTDENLSSPDKSSGVQCKNYSEVHSSNSFEDSSLNNISIVNQKSTNKTDFYDPLRTLRFFGVGLLLAGPGMHVWYRGLDRCFQKNSFLQLKTAKLTSILNASFLKNFIQKNQSIKKFHLNKNNVLQKTFLDQIFFLPFYLAAYLSVMSFLRLEGLTGVKHKLENNFSESLKASYKVWPAVQLINFYLVPLRHQIPVINFVGLFWNTYLGWKSENDS